MNLYSYQPQYDDGREHVNTRKEKIHFYSSGGFL